MKDYGSGAKIQCQCYSEDGKKVGYESTRRQKNITDLKSDHVYMWYDPYHSDSILSNVETKVSFEFCVTTDTGERDGLFTMKECGVCPIYFSEFPRFLRMMNLNPNLEWELTEELSKELGPDLCEAMQFESETIESPDEGEGDAIESIVRLDENKSNGIDAIERSDESKGDDAIESIGRRDESNSNGIEAIERSDEKEDNGIESVERSVDKEDSRFKSKPQSWLWSQCCWLGMAAVAMLLVGKLLTNFPQEFIRGDE